MKRAVNRLKARLPETTFLCLSNSNEIYINTILEVGLPLPSDPTNPVWLTESETWPHQPLLRNHHQPRALGRGDPRLATCRSSTRCFRTTA